MAQRVDASGHPNALQVLPTSPTSPRCGWYILTEPFSGAPVCLGSPRGLSCSSTSASQLDMMNLDAHYFPMDASTLRPSDDSIAWTDGERFEIAGRITLTGFANLAANHFMGLLFGGAGGANDGWDKTELTARIGFGVDNAGNILLIVADGTTASPTDTGINATSGVPFFFRLIFTKGTSVSLSIDGAAPTTVSTNLPTQIGGRGKTGQGDSNTNTKTVAISPIAWRYDPA